MNATGDPGWRPALNWRVVLFAAFPAALTPRYGAIGTGPVIVRIRMLWISSILMMAYIVAVTSFIVGVQGAIERPSWWWPAQLGLSLVSVGLLLWARSRPLDTTDDASLRKTYVANFMLGYALSLVPAMVGFMGVFVGGGMEPLLVGLLFFAAGISVTAPTRASIERYQEELHRSGSTKSLITLLQSQDLEAGDPRRSPP